MNDHHQSALSEGEPHAPTPWISLADLILATLATVVLVGMVVLLVFQVRLKNLEKALAAYEGKKPISSEDFEWFQQHRNGELLIEGQVPISREDMARWLEIKDQPLLPDGHKSIPEIDYSAWLSKRDKEVIPENHRAVPVEQLVGWNDLERPAGDIVWVPKKRWQEAQDALAAKEGIPNKPIVLGLDEVEGFRFASGSAELDSNFTKKLSGDVFTKIEEVVRNYGIEVLEIVGHTDGTPLGSGGGNLDLRLNTLDLDQLNRARVSALKGSSNADLGLMRALSVASYLHELTRRSADPKIRSLVFRAYSAAQLIDPKEDIIRGANDLDEPTRRRIELRFTRKSISLQE